MVDIAHIKESVAEALKSIDAEKIILFGSYAYGVPTEDSDLDICVVEKEYSSKWEEKTKIRNLLKHIRIPKDILVSCAEEYDFYKNQINSVFFDIHQKGIVVWQKNS
jgi:predicted nucleotidyltransferase